MNLELSQRMQRRLAIAIFAFPFLLACSSNNGGPPEQAQNPDGQAPDGQAQNPDAQAPVDSSTTAPDISVALASVRLGDEGCTHDESTGLKFQACAGPLPDAAMGTGLCGGPCKFTNAQLTFTSHASADGGPAAHIQIASVSLLDASTGAELQALTAYTPLAWNGTAYVAWDETVSSSTEVKASYTLSPPSWSTIDPSHSYSRQYKVRIQVVIEGTTVTLETAALSRDPPVAT